MATQLTQLKGTSYYIPGAVNTGVIVEGKDCLLIDTGLDRQAGKQILRCLEEEGLTPKVIINTHSHADHYGGNAIICKQTGAKVFASSLEKAVIENPYLEPFYLFSAAPVKDLSTRFLMAQPSPVHGVLEAGVFDSDGFHVEIIHLPGHSPEQIGVVSGDGVCFTADAYFAPSILDKYGLPYCADITSALQTLNTLWQSDYDLYLPCHGEPEVKATETILKNVGVIERALEQILVILCDGGRTREEVLAAFMIQNNRELNPVQYVLNHGAITACLSHLHLISKVGYHFQDGKMLWEKTTGQTCSPFG
ncbi:MAG: MBL fold metallo-hydrolase [Clostridiales bacterium]|nr:MBL fold metallo-hydrolase [Clostridiales bacterium]